MLTSGHNKMNILVVILNFGHASQKSNGFEVLDVLPRGPMVRSLDMLPRVPMELDFERASQRFNGFEFGRASQRFDGLMFRRASQRSHGFEIWTCFPEVQWNWILDVLPRGPMV